MNPQDDFWDDLRVRFEAGEITEAEMRAEGVAYISEHAQEIVEACARRGAAVEIAYDERGKAIAFRVKPS